MKFKLVGVIIVAAACPICFPKLAQIGTLLGFGALVRYEFYFFMASQTFVALVLIGLFLNFTKHKKVNTLILGTSSVILFFVSLYVVVSEYLSYLGLFGLVVAIYSQIKESKKCCNVLEADK